MLTEKEREDLEEWRRFRTDYPASCSDGVRSNLADAMLRLFPPGHADEITPERLVTYGNKKTLNQNYVTFSGEDVVLCYWCKSGQWDIEELQFGGSLGHRNSLWNFFRPRNMGEVWQLLARCGIPVTKGGE